MSKKNDKSAERLTCDVLMSAMDLWEKQNNTDKIVLYCTEEQAQHGLKSGFLRLNEKNQLEFIA